MVVLKDLGRHLRAIRFQVLETFKTDCRTTFKSTRVLKRVTTKSRFAASVEKNEAHCLVKSSEFMTAASRVVREQREEV